MVEKEKKDFNITDLPGVGAATAEKLEEAGFNTLMSIAVASPADMVEIAGVTEATARKIINVARNKLDMGFETGIEALEKRANVIKITTNSKALDGLFGGGIETNAITECYGQYGSGKSSLAHQLAVNVQLPKEKGGAEGIAVWLDTESTFRPERIKQIAENNGLDANEILKGIRVVRCFNSDHQMLVTEKVEDLIKNDNLPIKLLIVDSLMSLFRSDFSGRGQLSDRQQKLNKHMHTLLKLANNYSIAVYVTNQVMANPAVFFGDPTTAIGGHIVGHNCLTADSLVQLEDGTIIPIGDIKEGQKVVGNKINSDLKVSGASINKKIVNLDAREIFEIDTGNKIRASAKHRFFKLNNFEIEEIYAENIKKGDFIARVNSLEFKGSEQKLPKIEHTEMIIVNKEGSKFIKNQLEKLGFTRKEICEELKVKPRQLRRVLNQEYATNKENVNLLIQNGVGDKLFGFAQQYTSNKYRNIILPDNLTTEMAQILGYLIGDGNLYDTSIRFRDARVQVLESYNNLFEYTFNLRGSISKVKDKKCYQLGINSVELNNLFSLIKQNTYHYISRSPKEHIAAFIRGFADAEGHVDKKRKRVIISQKDDMVLRFIQLLLYRFDIQAFLEKTTTKEGKFCHRLRIDDIEGLKFAQKIGLTASDKFEIIEKWSDFKINERKIFPISRKEIWNLIKSEGYYPTHFMAPKSDKFLTIKNLKQTLEKFKLAGVKNELTKKKIAFIEHLIDSNITWCKVKKINKMDNKEILYDISVHGQENYIANGFLVHNSTYRVYLRRGKKDTRVAKMVDAPQIAELEVGFKISEKGIEDI
ncbi:MAG: DNA repair and recombination protein RadA [archaeon GW2011_AR20]|nr:MAG: DNA repair and recombination protein RadA [archaeon GW2011_AR20]AQS28433.1 hypothetical protein [uncultured archaeon]MBS3160270.1 DNA repair and recombination protein RadA [Candidatus Woesearchaeota archaeon]